VNTLSYDTLASHLKDSRLAVESRNPRKRGESSENLRNSRLMLRARIPRNSRKGESSQLRESILMVMPRNPKEREVLSPERLQAGGEI
jgi:hypothetical protein